MDRKLIITFISVFALVAGIGLYANNSAELPMEDAATEESTGSYIVQGSSIEAVTNAVHSVHAKITHELGIINAVAAELNAEQRGALRFNGAVLKIVEDRSGHGTHIASIIGNTDRADDESCQLERLS